MNTISDILEFLKKYCASLSGEMKVDVELANISALNEGDDYVNSGFPVIMSIVYIEEEATLKNTSVYHSVVDKNQLKLKKRSNTDKYLNIGVLFAAYYYRGQQNNYIESIKKLERVIQIFQNKNVFSADEIYSSTDSSELPVFPEHVEKFSLEMQSLKMEELNQLWGFLGGKFYPSVLYKIRLLPVESQVEQDSGIITEIHQITES